MANYNAQKVYAELDKVPIEELKKEFGFIKDFVQKKLEAAQKEAEEYASNLQAQIENL